MEEDKASAGLNNSEVRGKNQTGFQVGHRRLYIWVFKIIINLVVPPSPPTYQSDRPK